MKKPLVSVVMITYGHENFIEQAINGVLMQKCNFDVELIIANDCSPDNTDLLVNKIIKNHPKASWIKYIKHEKNIGMMPNFIFALKEAQGKYIALCEGDDYWIDPLKLKKQVGFLEENPDYEFSMGRVDRLIEKNGIIIKINEHVNPNKKETYILRDFIKFPFSQTSSFVFRNLNEPLPEWFRDVHAGDQSIVIINTGVEGKIKYHKDLFSIYRVNNGSVSFNTDPTGIKNKTDFFLNNVNAHTEYRFNTIIVFRKYINMLNYFTNSKNHFVKSFSRVVVLILLKIIKKI